MLDAAVAGLALGLSLIVAIGAQNAFVLRQGLRGEHVPAVVSVCVVSDVVLIAAGIGGAGALIAAQPGLLDVIRVGGALFLLTYGLHAAQRARHPQALDTAIGRAPTSRGGTIATTAALTWLNPHVYLDTVVLLGAVGNAHHDTRWWFAAGAAVASLLWFLALGFGARVLRPVFARPRAWQLLDGAIALIMVGIAISLIAGVS